MNGITINAESGKLEFLNGKGTRIEYILEMLNLMKLTGHTSFKFSYDLIDSNSYGPVWTPLEFKSTKCGEIVQKADDKLKEYLHELDSIQCTNRVLTLCKGENSITFVPIISRIYIEPDEIEISKDDLSFKIENVKFKIVYSEKLFENQEIDLEICQAQLDYINMRETDISRIINSDPTHPFSQLYEVIVAQHLANYIFENFELEISQKTLIPIDINDSIRRIDLHDIEFNMWGIVDKSNPNEDSYIAKTQLVRHSGLENWCVIHEFKNNTCNVITSNGDIGYLFDLQLLSNSRISRNKNEGGIILNIKPEKYKNIKIGDYGFARSTDREISQGAPPLVFEEKEEDSLECRVAKSVYNSAAEEMFEFEDGTFDFVIKNARTGFEMRKAAEAIQEVCPK